jgi:phenylacetate-coenzyme A ligase PaaK-like adenylate-forming protein
MSESTSPSEAPTYHGVIDIVDSHEKITTGTATVNFVMAHELETIANEIANDDLASKKMDRDVLGVSLSGGGMRSAAFQLGVIRAFKKVSLKIIQFNKEFRKIF